MPNNKIIDLERLSRFKDKLDIELDKKANVDGNYPTMTVGLADNLTPYSEDSGAEQDNPFIINGTGTNNNQEIVTVGDYGLFQGKQGNTVGVNQLVQNGNFASSSGWSANSGTLSVVSNVATFTPSAQYGNMVSGSLGTIVGHKYLLIAKLQLTSATTSVIVRLNNEGTQGVNTSSTTNVQYIYKVITASANNVFQVIDTRTSGWDAIKVYYAQLIDLTQWFNGNIPQDLLDHPEHWSWYCNKGDYIPYNVGTLENANGVKLISTGRNLWDEQTKVVSTHLENKNPVIVVPNQDIHFYNGGTDVFLKLRIYDTEDNLIQLVEGTVHNGSVYKMPSNAKYFNFEIAAAYGTTYNHDITISLYYTPEQGGEGYDKYYLYEQPYIVDTGNEVLRKAGSVCDYKEPNGTIHRVVGMAKLKDLPWTYSNGYFYSNVLSPNALKSSTANLLLSISKYKQGTISQVYSGDLYYCVGYDNFRNGSLCIKDTSIADTTALVNSFTDNDYLYYELATETTEQGTPFSENLPINDYGMLYWLDENDNLVGIPQGAKIFYPTNYKGFVDDMYSRVDGDSSKYVIQSELSEYTYSSLDIRKYALKYALTSSKDLNPDKIEVIDLYSLSFSYDSAYQVFTASLNGYNYGARTNILCEKYQVVSTPYTSMANLCITGNGGEAKIHIKNTSYTDATTLKNAMSGVLLAYEKA